MQTMLWYNRKRSVIGASTGEGNDTQSINGIVLGHAYAVIDVQQVEGLKMLQVSVCGAVTDVCFANECVHGRQLSVGW